MLHINDCASVALTLTAAARSQGLRWDLWTPMSGGTGSIRGLRRLKDIAAVVRLRGRYDLFHVHYGTFSYYAMCNRRPFALHLHGTDVRRDLASGGPTARLVRWGLDHAAIVYFSTPDLADQVRSFRPDAAWLPAPVQSQFFEPLPAQVRPHEFGMHKRVLFCSRWEPIKGSTDLLQVAAELMRTDPTIQILGFDWGQDRQRASSQGIELVPLLSRDSLPKFLRSFDIIVGQMRTGAIGLSELEAMALGLPVVAHFGYDDAYPERPPLVATTPSDAAEAVITILHNPEYYRKAAADGPRWVGKYHSAAALVQRLRHDYASVPAYR